MTYVADSARNWSARRRAKTIERSVDNALVEVAAHKAALAREHECLVYQAQTAVAGLPDEHFADLGRKFSISPSEAEGRLMRLALSQPAIVLKAVANTQAKIALAKPSAKAAAQ